MTYPIDKVTTKDNIDLHGLYLPGKGKKTVLIHVHGSAGNFYENPFIQTIYECFEKEGIGFLSTNNRGTGVYNIEAGTKYRGAAIEIFEECLLDIDAWIEFALSRGYKNIILQGHSFGTNKVQYYALNGKYISKIKALILLGFTDSYGTQLKYLENTDLKNEDYLKEANKLVAQNKPLQLLSNLYTNCGELPQTAQSYLNFMSKGSVLSEVLPLRKGRDLVNFQKINIPILGILGDQNEYTVIPIKDAMKLLESENKNCKCFQLINSPHNYIGKEEELINLLLDFIRKHDG